MLHRHSVSRPGEIFLLTSRVSRVDAIRTPVQPRLIVRQVVPRRTFNNSGRIPDRRPVDCVSLHLARETRGSISVVVVSATWIEGRPPRVRRIKCCRHFLLKGICSPVANCRTWACAGTTVHVTAPALAYACRTLQGGWKPVACMSHQQRGRLRVTDSV